MNPTFDNTDLDTPKMTLREMRIRNLFTYSPTENSTYSPTENSTYSPTENSTYSPTENSTDMDEEKEFIPPHTTMMDSLQTENCDENYSNNPKILVKNENYLISEAKPKRTSTLSKVVFMRTKILPAHIIDYTPMDFLLAILKRLFKYNTNSAINLIMRFQYKGWVLAGVHARDVAKTNAYITNESAKENYFPLKCYLESMTRQDLAFHIKMCKIYYKE